MKKKIVYCLILFCAIILQTSILPLISPMYATGDILLMFILVGAILDGFFAFFSWAIFAGIVYDLVSYTPVGVHALIFLLVVYFVSFFSRRFSVELRGIGLVLFLIFVIVATLLSRSVIVIMTTWNPQMLSFNWNVFGNFSVISVQIFSNMVLFFLTFIVLRKTKKFFSIE
ncbi:MAG: rod shape-determining protein MreD [Candidatus Moranbacteria bacterium]|nr:rod shape-determining protein MreD [Candidatus Moranbacteria bacterium]